MLESLFNKIAGLQACNFIKKRLTQAFSCRYNKVFKGNYFEEHRRPVASEYYLLIFIVFPC